MVFTQSVAVVSVLVFCVLLQVSGGTFKSEESLLDTRQNDFSCNNNDTLCYPENITAVPRSLIECVVDVCSCSECFEQGSDGRCTIEFPNCYDYNRGTASCEDDRRSQLVAFLLSLFLSGVGAANFYVGQTSLAAGQLSLLLVTILITCFAMCIPCCLVCCVMGDETKGSVVVILFFILVFIIVFGASLAMIAWWIADAVIFGTNSRDDGNGCPLKPF